MDHRPSGVRNQAQSHGRGQDQDQILGQTQADTAQARSGVRRGHHYQADAPTAGETVTHGVGGVTGARPLAVSGAFAHGIGAAASVILRQGQERGVSGSQDCSAHHPWERSQNDVCPTLRTPKAVSHCVASFEPLGRWLTLHRP